MSDERPPANADRVLDTELWEYNISEGGAPDALRRLADDLNELRNCVVISLSTFSSDSVVATLQAVIERS